MKGINANQINKFMYYVYKLINPITNTVFYVGKGSGDRAYCHQNFKDSNNNTHKDNTIKSILSYGLEVIVEFEHKNILHEDYAYELEKVLIEKIGIENLTNICTDSRPPSRKGKTYTMTAEHKQSLSKALKGKSKSAPVWNKGNTKETDVRIRESAKKRSETGNEHQRGKKRDPATVEKIKEKLTGRKMTDEQVSKMRQAKKGRTWEEIYGVEGATKRRAAKATRLRTAGMEDIVIS